MENSSFPSSAAAATAATTMTDANTTTTTTTTNSNSTTTSSNNNTAAAAAAAAAQPPPNSQFQNSLRSLNKSSYKIFKPPARNPNPNPSNPSPNPPPSNPNPNPNPSPQSQPPVYNIDKSDFREIVQKLTGSPAHRPPPAPSSSSSTVTPPPPPPPPATTSRLHRIRPPPLFNLSHVVGPPPAEVWARPALSPLPPLPTVSAAAESPITAYMRRLRGGPSPTAAAGAPPLSPLGFGCSGMMLSPSLLMPTSPRMPLPSPR